MTIVTRGLLAAFFGKLERPSFHSNLLECPQFQGLSYIDEPGFVSDKVDDEGNPLAPGVDVSLMEVTVAHLNAERLLDVLWVSGHCGPRRRFQTWLGNSFS